MSYQTVVEHVITDGNSVYYYVQLSLRNVEIRKTAKLRFAETILRGSCADAVIFGVVSTFRLTYCSSRCKMNCFCF